MAAKAKLAAAKAAAAKAATAAAKKGKKDEPVKASSAPLGLEKAKPLPAKDLTTFKSILQLYETKNYRKGLHQAGLLLAKHPNHGETLAMQGLFHHCLHEKEKGYELIKEGIKHDLKSHIVWHVMGIARRADREWEEACKCYSRAHAIDPENANILRDLALLQIQLRQYSAHLQSRHLLLRTNHKSRSAWLSLASAYLLDSQPLQTLSVLSSLESSTAEVDPSPSFEISEAAMFGVQVMEIAYPEEPGKALKYLEQREEKVVDREAWLAKRAQLLSKCGEEKRQKAEWAWRDLIERNPDSRECIKGFVEFNHASLVPSSTDGASEDDAKTLNLLSSLLSAYPKSRLVRRLTLDFSAGEPFRTSVTEYILDGVSRGVPSLWGDLKALSKRSSEKAAVVIDVAEGILAKASSDPAETTSTYVWTLHFLASAYSSAGRHTDGLTAVTQGLAHTPTLPDLHLLHGRILKRVGSPTLAALALEKAVGLDGQDRFLNGKWGKYLLRSGEVEKARDVVSRFTRKDAPSAVEDLKDMQALWYILEEVEVFKREGGREGWGGV